MEPQSPKLFTLEEVAESTGLPIEMLDAFERVGIIPPSIFADGKLYTHTQRELIRDMWMRIAQVGFAQQDVGPILHALKDELARKWNP